MKDILTCKSQQFCHTTTDALLVRVYIIIVNYIKYSAL